MERIRKQTDAERVSSGNATAYAGRIITMHDLLIAASFILMILAPCIVAARGASTEA